ncbi:MAG: calcium-binding protein [Leptolyngbyaceae cyanobacterium SL_7_1]|nr:calcium-binding protein [Leptolyngbyaceae cyanobacterium SL_7_1]
MSLDRSGNDTLIGSDGWDLLRGGSGDDYLYGGTGRDLLSGGAGQDQLIGGVGQDVLVGGAGDDRLFGQSGRDRMVGNQGRDLLDGGTGRDRLWSDRGEDSLVDRDGGDYLSGGRDADQFQIGNGALGATQIKDFQIGVDQLKFLELGVTFDQLSFRESRGNTRISYQGQKLVVLQGVDVDDLTPRDFLFGDATLVEDLQTALDRASQQGSPGTTLAIVTPDGFSWTGAGGVSNLQDQTPMQAGDRWMWQV